MVTWYCSADNLIWQVSIDHNMMSYIQKYKENQACMSLSTYYLEYGRHLVRLHRRRRLRRLRRPAYAPTTNTASHDNHKKINSWVSFSFLYGYGVSLGGPSGRRSSAINLLAFYHEWRPLIGYVTHVLFCEIVSSVAACAGGRFYVFLKCL